MHSGSNGKKTLQVQKYNKSMNETGEEIDKPMQVVAEMPPLPFNYDSGDSRVESIIDEVSSFCGYEFTVVPPNPDEEPGAPMPLADETPDEEEKDPNIEEPGSPSEPYPEGPSEELDKLREEYKEALAKNREEKSVYWAKLWQVIRFISNITCWTDEVDDTFFLQTRTQYYSVEQVNACRPNCCHCDTDVIEIPLEYGPLPEEGAFIHGKITVFINGKPIEEPISYEYLESHYDASTGRVIIMREDFPDTLLYRDNPCCLCRRKAVIMLKYNAGYQHIPAGLLPMLCPLIKKIDESKNGLSDCANTMTQVAGLLKFKKVGNIQYEWSDKDSNSAKTQTLYTDLYNIASVDEVYAISRCYIAETPDEMGDVI